MSHDASATYRGYRKQALYVLWRLLTDAEAEARIYHPEGSEDLAVYDLDQRLLEVVQVKDHATPLSLSDFKPQSIEGFFARMQARRLAAPNCIPILASFGELGPELAKAIATDGRERGSVSSKLHSANPDITVVEAANMLDALRDNVSYLDEGALRQGVFDALAGTIAGAHVQSGLELLLFWVFEASEHRRAITRTALLLQVQRVGDYLAALRDCSAEWMVSVRPITIETLDTETQARLRDEYQQGVQARWQHILAGADCARPQRLQELHEKLQRHSVAIIRGASGQGKSSLGWRYLRDYCSEGLRFEIQLVNGREHALRVANALRAHVVQLRLRAVVWLDISPSDTGWLELLRELADAGLKVLVAVREEDLSRAGLTADELDYGEVSLDMVTVQEAEMIFAKLSNRAHGDALDFADVWTRFGAADGGPLLEFTHLVTQGATLVAKLQKQVQRLQNEAVSGQEPVTSNHLRALALAAVAHAAGCRVDAARLCAAAELDPLTAPLNYFENEYLVRVSADGTVAGMHAIRSQALLAALLRDVPEGWPELVVACLPLLLDEDIETFLLAAFSRHPEYSPILEQSLSSLSLRSWGQAGGVSRALLWEGLSRYEAENRTVLATIIKEYEGSWYLFCDSSVGGSAEALWNLRKMMAELRHVELPLYELTPKERVYEPMRNWASRADVPACAPVGSVDWLGIADLAYWLGTKEIIGPLHTALQELMPQQLPDSLKLSEVAQVVSGFHALGSERFSTWHSDHAKELTNRFLTETGSIHVADDGSEVKVFFPVFFMGESDVATNWERRALQLIRLLHDIFPQRTKISSQGVGTEVMRDLLPFDLTQKSVDVGAFVSSRMAQTNATFANLVSYRQRRVRAWRDYAETVFALRKTVCEAFRELHRGWSRMLAQPIIRSHTIKELPGALLGQAQTLAQQPMLPRFAVDEWGFISEDRDSSSEQLGSRHARLSEVERFQTWCKAFGDFASSVNSIVTPVIQETVVFISLRNKDPDRPVDKDEGHLLLSNLGRAWQVLYSTQREFRRLFGSVVDLGRLDELEQHEQSTFRHLWAVAFTVVREPRRVVANAALNGERAMERRREEFHSALAKELLDVFRENGLRSIRLSNCKIDGEPRLAISCDHSEVTSLTAAPSLVAPALWRAVHSVDWRALEWMPLTVEWPRLLVVHLLRGQALISAGVQYTLETFFLSQEEPAAAPHQLIALPVPRASLAEAEIMVADVPILNAAFLWQGSLLTFTIVTMGFSSLIELVAQHNIPEEALNTALTRFSREISAALNDGRNAFEAFVDMLEPLTRAATERSSRAGEWLARAHAVSTSNLFSLEPEATIQVNMETFPPWLEGASARGAEINAIVIEIVDSFA